MLNIAGKLELVGELHPVDVPTLPKDACAAAVIKRLDGRNIIVSGLTREECRQIVGDFGEPITLRLEGLPC